MSNIQTNNFPYQQTIRKYIRDQEKHDLSIDKLTTKEYSAPFKGNKLK